LGRALGHSVVNMEQERMITNFHHVGAVPINGMQSEENISPIKLLTGIKPNSSSLRERNRTLIIPSLKVPFGMSIAETR
jgi:hypothetical protein